MQWSTRFQSRHESYFDYTKRLVEAGHYDDELKAMMEKRQAEPEENENRSE